MAAATEALQPGLYRADLTSQAAVVELLERIRRQQGPVGALIHLLPLGDGQPVESSEDAGVYDQIRREVKSLFNFAKGASTDLKEAAQQGGACVIAVTAMGGAFGSVRPFDQPAVFPGQGGVAGLVKTLAREWPAVRAKVIESNGKVAWTQPVFLSKQ